MSSSLLTWIMRLVRKFLHHILEEDLYHSEILRKGSSTASQLEDDLMVPILEFRSGAISRHYLPILI